MKTTGDLLKHLKKNFTITELENRELATLYIFCQEDKNIPLSTLSNPIKHLYKKWLNLYTINELIVILQNNGRLDSVGANLMETLRKSESTALNIHVKKTRDLYYKYI